AAFNTAVLLDSALKLPEIARIRMGVRTVLMILDRCFEKIATNGNDPSQRREINWRRERSLLTFDVEIYTVMSENEIKGEQAAALMQSEFTMSPAPFLPFNDAGHWPFAYSVRLSMRSAFLIVCQFLSSRFFER